MIALLPLLLLLTACDRQPDWMSACVRGDIPCDWGYR